MKSVVALLAAALFALAGCNSGGRNQNSTDLRILNAVVDAEPLDVLVEGDLKFSAVARNQFTEYANFTGGTRQIAARSSTTQETLVDLPAGLASGQRSTAVFYSTRAAMKFFVVAEDTIAPPSGKARVRVVNLAEGAGTVDVYLTKTDLAGAGTATVAGAAVNATTGTGVVDGGDYKVIVTPAGKTDVLFQSPAALPFGSGNGVTVVVTANSGALLVNVALLQQGQSGLINVAANTQARYRLTNGMVDATVDLKVDNVKTVEGAVPLATSSYLATTAGSKSLRTEAANAPGAALATATSTFDSGGDYTVVAAGTLASPAIVRLSDDNAVPVTGNVRLRVVNLLTDGTNIDAVIDATTQASNVAPRTASAYVSIAATIVAVLEVKTAGGAQTLATVSPAEFPADQVYTVYVAGTSVAPQVKIVVDR